MKRSLLALLAVLVSLPASADTGSRDATDIVRDAINHWRGLSSQGAMTMTIHRPDWERSMSMDTWTQGEKRSLIRVTAPRKDRGNGTLMDDNNMWSFSPKINRVIKVPSSMMNNDVSRSDEIVEEYDHILLSESEVDGHVTYEIESIPHEDAAVVWGKEILIVRNDNVLIEHRFYDQDGELVKSLRTLQIDEMGGRTVATQQRMEKVDAPDEWTEIIVDAVEFDVELSDNIFTLSNLRNPRN
jgi:outer membrane lipoprotein-sorting protein